MTCLAYISQPQEITQIKEYCSENDLEIKNVYTDKGVSQGSILGSLTLKKLISEIQPSEHLILVNILRLGRNTRECLGIVEKIREKKANLISLNPSIDLSSELGESVFDILMAFSTLERENQKVIENKRKIKHRNRPAFGWRCVSSNKPFVEVPEQQLVIQKILDLYEKKVSICEIARQLNSDGDDKVLPLNKKNKKDQIWFDTGVRRVLRDTGVIPEKKK